jgi:hypothetical protein
MWWCRLRRALQLFCLLEVLQRLWLQRLWLLLLLLLLLVLVLGVGVVVVVVVL